MQDNMLNISKKIFDSELRGKERFKELISK